MGKEVSTVFSAHDKTSHVLHKIAEQAGELNEKVAHLKESIAGAIDQKVAAIGLSLGFGEMAHKMYEVYEAAEDATRSLSGAYVMSGRFASLGAEGELAASLEIASKTYDKLEQKAMHGVASVQTYVDAYQGLSSVLGKTKARTEDIMDVSSELVLRYRALGQNASQAAESTRQLGNSIATGAGPASKEMLKVSGLTKKEWMALQHAGPAKMWEGVYKAVEKTKKPLEGQFKGPGDQLRRIQITAEHFMRTMGGPVMEQLGEQAERLATWLSTNKEEAAEIAHMFADKVVRGLHIAIEAARILAAHWKPILTGLTLLFGGSKVISGGASAIKLGGALINATTSVHKWAGTLGGAGAKMAESSSGFSRMLGTVGTSFGGILGKSLGSLTTGTASLGAKLGAAGMVAATGLAAFELGTWLDSKLGISDMASDAMRALTGRGGEDRAREEKGIEEHTKRLKEARAAETADIAKRRAVAAKAHHMTVAAYTKRAQAAGAMAKAGAVAENEMTKDFKPAKADNMFDFRNSRFSITQAFAAGFDPDRIAVAFSNDLASLGERRLSSGHAPGGTVR